MSDRAPIISSRSDVDWCWYLRNHGPQGEKLERALHDIGVLQPGGWAPWQDSVMTDTGAPTEVFFSADQTTMSLCTEVDDPAKDPSTRMATVCEKIVQLGGALPPSALRDVISAAQSGAELRYGAWLGLHQTQHSLGLTMLAEIPTDASDLAGLLIPTQLSSLLSALGDTVWLNKIGYRTDTDETTLYFETQRTPDEVVLQLCDVAKTSPEPLLRDIIDMLDTGSLNAQLPKTFGFSFRFTPNASIPTLTLYVDAKSFFETDDVIANRVRAFPGEHVASYTALAEQLLPAPNGLTHHGKIGLEARGDNWPLLSIGVAAPWICPFESA